MLFGHGMTAREEVLIFHVLDGDGMIVIRIFCFQSGQCNAAAADHRIPQSVDGIAADGADIELGVKHIGRDIFVDNVFTVHQLNYGDTQRLGQGLQQTDIRQAFSRFP